jgi:hypothetical protein
MTAALMPASVQDGSLLLRCLGVRPDEPDPGPPPTMSDWAEVLRQAGENGLIPLLYHRVKLAGAALPVPQAMLDYLRDAALQSAAVSLQTERELAEILEAFRHHGIAVIVLKGGYLGQVVYESFALRTMCDLDLMVRRDALARAADVLTGLGYVPQYYGVEEVDYARHHHLRPMAKANGVRIEIHWTIAQPTVPFAIDLDGLWERARTARVAGVDALVLSPEDLILHLCLHASFSHGFRFGVRAAWDIREAVRHFGDRMDWDQLVRRAQQWRIGRYVYVTLRLVREMLAADIPPAALAALEPPGFPSEVLTWTRTSMFSPERDAVVSPSMAMLWTTRRLQGKLGVLLHTLYPSRTAMARIYRMPAGSSRIYLYYPVRWADLLLRYGRHAWGLWRGDHRTRDQLRAVAERSALREWLRCP